MTDAERSRRYRARFPERIAQRWKERHAQRWKECRAKRIEKTRAFLDAYRLERGCRTCGYNQHPAALDFAHRDRTAKSFNVLRAATAGWPLTRIREEVAKCDVLCAICHRIETTKERARSNGQGCSAVRLRDGRRVVDQSGL